MADESVRKFRLTTIIYWVLLLYIIAALIWWFLSLAKQNEAMYVLRKEHLITTVPDHNSSAFQDQLKDIEDVRRRNVAKYIGEGGTFLILILIGAVYLYRSVRRQLRWHRQQQNFIMAISHELKTPIAVSRLNLETLQRYKLDEQKKEKLLHMTLQENLRLDTLINNILLSSQLDGHSYHVSKEELDLSHLVKDVAQQFCSRYSDRKFVQLIAPDVDFYGDPLLLKLLVSNLLENANKYSPKEKPITLELKEMNGSISMQVKDEGPGVPDEEKKNIFHKFYRVGNEQTRKAKGTGLGLYLCKKIAEDHNGTIKVIDNHPQGSNFMVSFPVK
jgi:signal transduction histidine kinase